MHLAKPLDRDVSINLRGIEIFMPEHDLQAPQVRPAFQHQCRRRVTQHVTTAATIDSNVIQVATDDCRHGRRIGVDLKVAGTLRVPWQRTAADRVGHRSLGGRHGGACLLLMQL